MLAFSFVWAASHLHFLISYSHHWSKAPNLLGLQAPPVTALANATTSNRSTFTDWQSASKRQTFQASPAQQLFFSTIEGFSDQALKTLPGSPVLHLLQNLLALPPIVETEKLPKSLPLFSKVSVRRVAPTAVQVRLQGQLVAEMPDYNRAMEMAHRIHQAISQPNFRPIQVQPGLLQGQPGGKVGNRVLFTVDSDLAMQLQRNADLLAIHWVNRLRLILGAPSLDLAEAQAQMYRLAETSDQLEGLASWYGPYFHGRLTATGEIFNQDDLTAAHPSLPFDTYLKVTNVENGRSVIVRVNDRGPYFENRNLDLSREAARRLSSEEAGVVPFKAVIMEPVAVPYKVAGRQTDS